jgi:hypothetical protein
VALPLILGGPIVRRVEGRYASFWLALSRPATVVAHVWSGMQASTGVGQVQSGSPLAATGEAATIDFGGALHVCVVTARGAAGFTPGSIWSYDLEVQEAGKPARGFKELGLLQDDTTAARLDGAVDPSAPPHLALGYAPDQLPSFVTPAATLEELHLAHGSCRNTNTEGPETMSFLDDIIREHLTDGPNRLQQLFLTGDQIYADDVSRGIMKPIAELAAGLNGGRNGEVAPVAGTDRPVNLETFPNLRRLKLVREEARFTTTDGHNHLISFSEFAAHHLLAWSTHPWRPLAEEKDVYVPVPPNSPVPNLLTDWEACAEADKKAEGATPFEKWKNRETKPKDGKPSAFTEDANRTIVYRAGVSKVARVLANCATYMIFDDHEITDDWNQNKRWRNRVVATPLGRAIIRNGMLAYAVFQAWGNDPRAFTRADPSIFDPVDHDPNPATDEGPWAVQKVGPPVVLTNNARVLKLASAAASAPGPFPMFPLRPVEELLGLDDPDTSTNPTKKAVWHWRIDFPAHRVVALDPRTRRSFHGEGEAPPNLVGTTLNDQIPAGPLAAPQELLVVLAPAPVLAPHIVHNVVQPVSALYQDIAISITGKEKMDPCKPGPPVTGTEHRDVEGWNGDEPAMEALFARLAGYRSVLLLSGDVHFASSVGLDYWNDTLTDPVSRIVQLTSSGVRNHKGGTLQVLIRALPIGQRLLRGQPREVLAWKGPAPIKMPAGTHIAPGRRARMLRSPALLPNNGWPKDTTVDHPPDWRWRATVLRDSRTGSQLPVGYPVQDAIAEVDPGAPLDGMARIAARHASAAMHHTVPLRLSIFDHNVGTVSFRKAGNGTNVLHTLWTEAAPGSAVGAPFTVHESPLQPAAGDVGPQLVTKDQDDEGGEP